MAGGATELATAYLSLVPSMRGAQGQIARELGAVDSGAIGRDMGGKMGGGLASTFKGLVGPVLAGVAAGALSGFIAEAARASDATDKFKSTMNFAGLDTSAIDAATKSAKDYADQTVYELSDIQKTMATLAANGVDDYTGITTAAGNLNAVAGGNAETFKSVSLALGQSAGAGKLMAEDWNMLADAIPGASGQLQKAMLDAGAYTGNFKKAMENGEITAEEFQAAIVTLGSQPVAVEAARSVTTFEGALGNLNATINSGLMGALDAMKPAITGAINGLATGIGVMFDWAGKFLPGMYDLFVKGDITPALLDALGVSEDSPVIAGLYWLQDKIYAGFQQVSNFLAGFRFSAVEASTLWPQLDEAAQLGVNIRWRIQAVLEGIQSFIGGFRIPPVEWAGAWGDLNDIERFGVDARQKFEVGLQGIKDFITGFTIPGPTLAAAGFDVTPMAAAGETVRGIFDGLGAVLGPLIPQVVALWSAVSPLGTVFQALLPFLPPLLDVIGQLAVVIGTSLVTAIAAILPSIQSLQATFVTLFTGVLAAVLPTIVQLVTMLGSTLATLIPVVAGVIAQVAPLVATLVSQLAPILMQLISAVLPVVVSAFGQLLPAIAPLVQMIAGLLIPAISALMPIVVTVFSVVVGIITQAMQIVQGIIQVVTGIITGNWSQAFSGLLNIVSGVFGFIVAVISGGLQLAISLVGNGLNAVSGFFSSIFSGIVSYLSGVWTNITSGASGMLGELVGFFGGLLGKITGAIGDVGGALFTTGKNVIQGLIDGIGSMMGAIGRAVLNIVPEAIRGPFEDLLGIHSPSRVFRAYGVNIGEGLVLGIQDMYDPVAEATAALAWVPDTVPDGLASMDATWRAAAMPGATGPGVVVNQEVYPAEKMSEENLANVSARKIVGAIA